MDGLNAVELHDAAHGFRVGRNIMTNASVHPGLKRDVLTLDIEKFFPSCAKAAVLEALPVGFDKDPIASFCFHKGFLPTGAPTSPVLGNILLSSVDETITQWCAANDVRYTRYADDLAFSGVGLRTKVNQITRMTRLALDAVGLRLKDKKTKLMLYHSRQEITGIAVSYGRVRLGQQRRQQYWEHFQDAALPLSRQDLGVLAFIRSADQKMWRRLEVALEKRKTHE